MITLRGILAGLAVVVALVGLVQLGLAFERQNQKRIEAEARLEQSLKRTEQLLKNSENLYQSLLLEQKKAPALERLVEVTLIREPIITETIREIYSLPPTYQCINNPSILVALDGVSKLKDARPAISASGDSSSEGTGEALDLSGTTSGGTLQ